MGGKSVEEEWKKSIISIHRFLVQTVTNLSREEFINTNRVNFIFDVKIIGSISI